MELTLQSEIQSSLNRTRDLIESKILWNTSGLIFKNSVLIEILINMKDLLIKSEKHLNKRISFTDDVVQDERLKIIDVTDLISNFRDAACHNDSFRRKFETTVLSFNEIAGKLVLMKIGDVIIGNKYSDDIAFNMGINILYLKRHLERAFFEVEDGFMSHFSFNKL